MTTTPITAPKGLEGVVAASTRMSHVDGLAGELIIGGYRLDEIAGRATFEEIAFVLWNLAMGKDGALPKQDEFSALQKELAAMRPIPDVALQVIRAAKDAPPMDALRMAMAMMSLDDANVKDESPAANYRRAKLLTARTPKIIAAHDRLRRGLEPIAPNPALNRAANFLYMITGKEPAPAAAQALDTYWTTVIDHGMNASTFTARVIASKIGRAHV